MFETPSNTILNKNPQIKRSKVRNMKYLVIVRNPYLFLKIEIEMLRKMEVFRERHGEF